MKRIGIFAGMAALALAASGEAKAGTDIFLSNASSIGEYDASTGNAINASLISGLDNPAGIAISGGDIFVANNPTTGAAGTIGEYTTSGATVNASLISGLSTPAGIAVSGGTSSSLTAPPARSGNTPPPA